MNIIELLQDEGIDYWTEGKNVGRNYVNIQCPYCGDESNHLGINYKSLRVRCWRCGGHKLTQLLVDLFDYDYSKAKQVVRSLGADSTPPLNVASSATPSYDGSKDVLMPRESSIHFPKLHSEYLRSRGFPPLKTIRKYKLRAVHNLGSYKFRIIIPVFIDRRLVSFTARDVTDEQDPPYKMASKNECLLDRDQILFNIDSVPKGGDAILVEGPLDAMKLGDNAICPFGIEVNLGQILLLKKKKIRRLFIIFDNPKKDRGAGQRAAKELAPILAPLIERRIEIVTLTKVMDPGDLTIESAKALKAELGFSI